MMLHVFFIWVCADFPAYYESATYDHRVFSNENLKYLDKDGVNSIGFGSPGSILCCFSLARTIQN